jgi:ABC-type amino acid transport substrate-binding protein
LNNFLQEIKQDGRFEKMHDKWFKKTDWFKYVR